LNLQIKDLPGSLANYTGSEHFGEILAILGRENRRDALHVDSAYKSGCGAFVTTDSDILTHKEKLLALLGIRFLDPSVELSGLEPATAGASPK